jgi:hypothetical protein
MKKRRENCTYVNKMHKFAIQMYKYTDEKQERTIDGNPEAYWQQEYLKPGGAAQAFGKARF